MMRRRTRRVLLAGYYGFGNAGDELLLRTLLHHLRAALPELRVTVATDDPVGHSAALGVETVHLRDLSALVRAASASRAVIVGGGGLFHDYGGFDPAAVLTREHSGLGFASTWPLLATATRTPLVLLGVGVGPLHSELGSRYTRTSFEQAALATVRDEPSLAALTATGLTSRRVAVTADPALLLDVPDVQAQQQALAAAGLPEGSGPVVAVALRQWNVDVDPAHWQREVARALSLLVDEGMRVLFVPFQEHPGDLTDDRAVADQVRALLARPQQAVIAPVGVTLDAKVALVAAADVVLGMRLHSLVVAAVAGRAAVGLSYDPKVAGFCAAAGSAEVIPLGAIDAEAVSAACVSATPPAQGRLAQLRQRASADVAAVVDLIQADDIHLPALTPMAEGLLADTLATLAVDLHDAKLHVDELGVRAQRLEQAEREIAESKRAAEAALAEQRQAALAEEQRAALAEERQAALAEERHTVLLTENLALVKQMDLLRSAADEAAKAHELLDEIMASTGWRVVRALWSVRTAAAPPGGARDRVLRRALRRPDHPAVAVTGGDAATVAPSPDAPVPELARAGVGWRLTVGMIRRSRPVARRLPEPLKALLRPAVHHVVTPRPVTWVPYTDAASASAEAPEDQLIRLVGVQDRDVAENAALPLVSVLLPVFDQADMLRQAALSVLEQSYPRVELIILDDGSRDDIEPVLAELAAFSDVRVLRQPNQKLPRALTHASAVARGDLVTWTSADNVMEPDALTVLVGTLLAHPESVLAYADMRVIDSDGRPLLDRSYRPHNVDPLRPDVIRLNRSAEPLGLEGDNYINACFLYRREAAAAVGGDYADDLRGLEDYDFWLRLQRCGELRHAANAEPLYAYRVHERTMSHELLTTRAAEHQARMRLLMDHEQARRTRQALPWHLRLSPDLDEDVSAQLRQLAVAAGATAATGKPADVAGCEEKQLLVVPEGAPGGDPVWLELLGEDYLLHWRSARDGSTTSLPLPRGVQVDALALKARDHAKNLWEFLQAGSRPVLLAHVGLRDYGLDVAALQVLAQANPWAFFVLVDDAAAADPHTGEDAARGLENVVYLGARPVGVPYQTYACADVLWLPPTLRAVSTQAYRASLLLALSTGRQLVVGQASDLLPVPYQRHLDGGADALARAVLPIMGIQLDRDVLDAQLRALSPVGALQKALRLAEGATQELAAPRPDFGAAAPAAVSPVPWPVRDDRQLPPLRVCLAVDSLDAGGLEEVVRQLATQLPARGVDVSVLCRTTGGRIAELLAAAGVEVFAAEANTAAVTTYLRDRRPDLVHSSYVGLPVLECATELEIPVLETIQNTYVWLDEVGWEVERARSRHFDTAVAVSEFAGAYYRKHHGSFPLERFRVLPNAADPSRVTGPPRSVARASLGLTTETLFLALGRYDGQKNQLGLLRAFERFAADEPGARLLVAGSVSDPVYYADVVALHERLAARDQVRIERARNDTGMLYAAADAVVANSFFEGWSLTATEAVCAGVPIVHSDCGGGREIVGADGQRGILFANPGGDPLELDARTLSAAVRCTPQANEDDLVAALQSAHADRRAWAARGSGIRSYARRAFHADACADGYARIYRDLVAR